MKHFNPKNIPLVLVVVSMTLVLAACNSSDYRNEDNWNDVVAMSFPDSDPVSTEIQKLRSDIAKVSGEIKTLMSQQGRLASFYNALGEEYRRFSMFRPALDAYRGSLDIQPLNHVVQYKAGVMAGQLYTLEVDATKKAQLLEQAEQHYKNALSKTPDHIDSLYALAVLLYFEKKDAPGAQVYVDNLLLKDANDVRTLFLAGRIAAETGAFENAIRYYERILSQDTTDANKEQARANLEVLNTRQ